MKPLREFPFLRANGNSREFHIERNGVFHGEIGLLRMNSRETPPPTEEKRKYHHVR